MCRNQFCRKRKLITVRDSDTTIIYFQYCQLFEGKYLDLSSSSPISISYLFLPSQVSSERILSRNHQQTLQMPLYHRIHTLTDHIRPVAPASSGKSISPKLGTHTIYFDLHHIPIFQFLPYRFGNPIVCNLSLTSSCRLPFLQTSHMSRAWHPSGC